MISPLTLIVVLATTLAVASPVPETKKVQPSLQDISAKRLVKADCIGLHDKQSFSEKAVTDAFNKLKSLANVELHKKPRDSAGAHYPHDVNPTIALNDMILNTLALDQWEGCKPYQQGTKYLDFPIFANGSEFKSGDAGKDRVLAIAQGSKAPFSNFVYCGVMSRRGQQNKAFASCEQAVKS